MFIVVFLIFNLSETLMFLLFVKAGRVRDYILLGLQCEFSISKSCLKDNIEWTMNII